MGDDENNIWYEPLAAALEASRTEVVRRMKAAGAPLTFTVQQTVVIDDDTGSWRSDQRTEPVSGLFDDRLMMSMLERSSPGTLLLGTRTTLEPLAAALDEASTLGDARVVGIWPALTGAEGVLARCVGPVCLHYLLNLTDLDAPDDVLVQQLADELAELASANSITTTRQLALGGLKPTGECRRRDVMLRPLSEVERVSVVEIQNATWTSRLLPGTRFFPPQHLQHFVPDTLLEVTSIRPLDEALDTSTLLKRVVLAAFLLGFDLSGAGTVVSFERPVWIAQGRSHTPFSLGVKPGVQPRDVNLDDFEAIVNLAYRIPEFTEDEQSSQEIVLHRVERGCSAEVKGAGFLDCVIALEAALLGGVDSELSYRFSLYGALFLAETRDVDDTFARLRNVYDVRSRLVHGSPVKLAKREAATNDAQEFARAIVLKSVESGWPDTKDLDAQARRRT